MPTSIPPKIRVMLSDDHVLLRMGLSYALNNQPDIEVVAEAEDGIEAVNVFKAHRPDVVILDLRMPKRNGMETIKHLRREFDPVRVLVLSNYGTGDEIAAALQAGALGFVMKDSPLADLFLAVREVYAGNQFFPSGIARRLAARITTQLSSRESEVLIFLGRGLSNKEIGSALNIAEGTVKIHITSIFSKLGVADRTQALISGIKRGIIQID